MRFIFWIKRSSENFCNEHGYELCSAWIAGAKLGKILNIPMLPFVGADSETAGFGTMWRFQRNDPPWIPRELLFVARFGKRWMLEGDSEGIHPWSTEKPWLFWINEPESTIEWWIHWDYIIWITFSKIICPATWYNPWHQRNLRRWSKCIRPSHIWDVVKRWDCFTRVKQLQIKSRWRFFSANFCLEDWIFLDTCTSRPFLHLSNESVGRQRPCVTNHVRLHLEKRVNF